MLSTILYVTGYCCSPYPPVKLVIAAIKFIKPITTIMMKVGFLIMAFVSNFIKNHKAENENLLAVLAVKLLVEIFLVSNSSLIIFSFFAFSFFALKENLK